MCKKATCQNCRKFYLIFSYPENVFSSPSTCARLLMGPITPKTRRFERRIISLIPISIVPCFDPIRSQTPFPLLPDLHPLSNNPSLHPIKPPSPPNTN